MLHLTHGGFYENILRSNLPDRKVRLLNIQLATAIVRAFIHICRNFTFELDIR